MKSEILSVKEKIGYGIAFITVTASSSALACPKGQHPHGDTGSHHKGGWCSYEQ